MPDEGTIGFLGAGQMARALCRGIVKAGLYRPEQVFASDTYPASLTSFTQETGAGAAGSNLELTQQCGILILSVKPPDVPSVLADIAPAFTSEHLLISIAAGIKLERLQAGLPTGSAVVRVMPNTPCLAGMGASAYTAGLAVSPAAKEKVAAILTASGYAVELGENYFDAVTGLSGSGPAFVFLIIEALADGGVKAGLPRATALRLAAETVRGAAQLCLETGKHPGELKDQVASPAGTTIEGLAVLEAEGVRSALIEAVGAAARRSAELGAK